MADFNFSAEGGTTRPPEEIRKILLLQSVYNYSEMKEKYNKDTGMKIGCDVALVRCRMMRIFDDNIGLINRLYPGEYARVEALCASMKISELNEAFKFFSILFDKIGLTKIDNKPALPLDIIERNRIKGGM